MNIKYLIISVLCLCFTSTALAGNSIITCQYQVTIQDEQQSSTQEWIVWKKDNQVEILQKGAPYSVVWKRLKSGALQRKEVHHAFKTVINYEPGDATILGVNNRWESHAALFDQFLLNGLQAAGKSDKHSFSDLYKGSKKSGELYQGNLYGRRYQVTWLPQENLPARVEIKSNHIKELIELVEIYNNENNPYPRIDWEEKYDDIDFADLGDNETHPLVRAMYHSGESSHHYPEHSN